MRSFFVRWASTTFAVFIATGFVPGITAENPEALILAGLLLGILNAVVRPVLLLLSLPLIVLTLGLMIPLINAMLLSFVGGGWIPGFHVARFGSALVGSIVISLVSWALNGLLRAESSTVRVHTYSPPSPPSNPTGMKKVQGRVIEHESDPE
ncbi:MAG: phage holin family protein [Verrucomicrobia bacterium]|nr:phage holin family protein [Verrucomicrobiota bacterium]